MAKESFEKDLKIKPSKKMPEFKIKKKDPGQLEEIQKKLTNYAIAMHMIAKSLKSIDKFDESKELLNRALHVAENYMPSRNPKLEETIRADIEEVNKDIRYLPAKRVIGDPELLLDKLENLIVDKNKNLDRSVMNRSKDNLTKSPSEK